MAESDDVEVIKTFTHGRKVPTLIGKWPNSDKSIPGGPYTPFQLAVAGLLVVMGWFTRPLWTMGLFLDLVALGMLAFLGLIATRKATLSTQNPFLKVGNSLQAASQNRANKFGVSSLQKTLESKAARGGFVITHDYVFSTFPDLPQTPKTVLGSLAVSQESVSSGISEFLGDFDSLEPEAEPQVSVIKEAAPVFGETNLERFLRSGGLKK